MNNNDKPELDDFLLHYGVGHLRSTPGSGRYPYGSGDDPNQHSGTFLTRVKELRKANIPYTEMDKSKPDYGQTYTGQTAIAKHLGMTTTEYRQALTYANNQEKMARINQINAYLQQNVGYSEIARKMGLPSESSVRSLLKSSVKSNIDISRDTADLLKNRLEDLAKTDPKAMIDIGKAVENELGITRTKLDNAVYLLEQEDGYKTYGGRIPNVTDPTGNHQITMNVLAMPDTSWKDFYDRDNNHIYSVKDYLKDVSPEAVNAKWQYPESLDKSRVMIRYAEEGGLQKDGLIELRRNVPDLDLQGKNYAQVRILVDNDKYLKGMAAYAPDQSVFPDGIDVIFNTNKHTGTPFDKVLKEVHRNKDGSIDRDNPFGSLIKDADKGGQYEYIGKDGKKHLGLINKRADEGDWQEWKDELSAQFLSKQTVQLAKRQLDLAVTEKQQEFQDIMNLNNDTVKKYYLESFANDCDSAAVHLKAAALPRQKFQVILPLTSLKDNEVFAPNYADGEQLALIRYPHAGTFEIPVLTVNNKNREGRSLIGINSTDAIGIKKAAADQLSGADFDGDTVMVVPISDKIRISHREPLRGLKNFEPKEDYGCDPDKTYKDKDGNEHYFNKYGIEFPVMKRTQLEMGKISNLISDMQIRGASDDELARAVRHSMVVIDAEKHHLDYKSSEAENGIAALKKKYQAHLNEDGREVTGASTLISQAKSEYDAPKRKGQAKINIKGTKYYDPDRPEGALIWTEDPKATYLKTTIDKRTGLPVTKEKTSYTKSTKMAETDDARTLISDDDTKIERVYASFANTMKALANEARKEAYNTKGIAYNSEARKKYQTEVDDLLVQLDTATKNKPRERAAQVLANSAARAKKQDNPGMTKEEYKKVKNQEITRARARVGASRTEVTIDDRQWEAIQSGAINSTTLSKILNHTDMDKVRERATPRARKEVTSAMEARAKNYAASGKTNAEIAKVLGISPSTVSKILNS